MDESSLSPASFTRSRAPRTSQRKQSKCHGCHQSSHLKRELPHPNNKVKPKQKPSSSLKPKRCGRKRKLQSISDLPSQVVKSNLKKGKCQSGSDAYSSDDKRLSILCKAESAILVKSSLDSEKSSPDCQEINTPGKEQRSPGFQKDQQTRTSCEDYVRKILEVLKARQFLKVVDMIKECMGTYKEKSCMELECIMKEATLMGNLFIFNHLLLHGVSSVQTESLHKASEQGHSDIVSYLMKYRKETVNIQDSNGNTALMLCQTNGGSSHITQVLIKAQADVNMQNKAGETALMIAIRCLNVNNVLYLLKANADIEVEDCEGNTAYSVAAAIGMKSLLDALRKFTKDETSTPLVDAVLSQDFSLLETLLVGETFDVNDCVKCNGESPISILFNSNLKTRTNELANCGNKDDFSNYKKPHHKYNLQYDVLPFTFTEKELEVLKVLLNANSWVDQLGWFGLNAPLYIAIETESMDILELFSNVNACRLNDSLVYDVAISKAVNTVKRRDILMCLKSFIFYTDEYVDFSYTLHKFIKQGNSEVVGDLIDCLGYEFDLLSALSEAAKCGWYLVFLEIVKKTCIQQHNLFFKNLVGGKYGFSWLCDAVAGYNPKFVEYLLEAGADPEFKHDTLGHPMFLCHSKKLCELLVQFGAKPKLLIADHRDLVEQSVMRAIKGGLCGVLGVWINNGLNLDSNHLSCVINLLERRMLLTTDMREFFLSRTADIDQDYLTLNANFMTALRCQDEKFVEALLAKGADVNHGDSLQIAIESENVSLVQILITNGADVNKKSKPDCPRTSPLVKAVIHSTYDIVKLLLENGAFINDLIEGEDYSYALYYAIHHHKPLKLMKLLLNKGANLNSSREYCFPPILIAAVELYYTDTDFIRLLVEKGADVNSRNFKYSSALARSIALNFFNKAKCLVEMGADVNLQDKSGNTALMEAACVKFSEIKELIIPLLISKGARVNDVDNNGCSALKKASNECNFFAFSALLCSPGLIVNLQNDTGEAWCPQYLLSGSVDETPLDKCNRETFAACLLSSGANFASDCTDFVFTVHRCTVVGEFNFLNTLILSGEFAPVLMEEKSSFCEIPYYGMFDDSILRELSNVLSPLCLALICNRKSVAERMIECNYLTMSDITLLPYHKGVRQFFDEEDSGPWQINTGDILKRLGESPMSLLKLCAVKVSDCIGSKLGRRQRIRNTKLPSVLQKTLMYQTNGKFLPTQADDDQWWDYLTDPYHVIHYHFSWRIV